MDLKELIQIVKQNGVAGAGGAGFPSYAKLDQRANTIIINCAECEPLLRVHRQLMQKYAYEIMWTLQLIGESLGAKNLFIGVKEAYKKTVNAIKANQYSFPGIQLKLLKESYPMGDEVVLIYETTGKVVPPGSIPLELGVIVFNVETILNIYYAIEQQKPVTHKYVTIAGEVKNSVTLMLPIGMSVEEAVQTAGGVTTLNPVYIMGGPMTGNIVNSYDSITKTTNAILVMPEEHCLINRRRSNISIDMKRAMASCCQCEMCTDLCPRNLLGHPITPHQFMRAATSKSTQEVGTFLDTMFCCSCGVCEMYACPQGLSPRKMITEYKDGLRKKGVPISKGIPLKEVNSLREYRAVPMERLISRLDLTQYNSEALLWEMTVNTELVKINLSQHIGAKAVPVVKKMDNVKAGDMIAQAEEGKLSLPVHASISGKIVEVNDRYIMIRADREKNAV